MGSNRRMRALVRGLVVVLAIALGVAGPAYAHDDVERGVARFYAADFEQALAAFARAEASSDLTRADLVRLLFFRALVHGAFGSDAARDLDLLRLASLEPQHPMSDAPPPVRDAFERVRRDVGGPLAVSITVEPAAGGAIVRARVSNDPGGLARRIVVRAQAGAGEVRGEEGQVLVVGAAGTALEHTATVVGPGGAVIAEQTGASAIPTDRALVSEPTPAVTGGDDGLAWGLGIGAAVLVAAAAVVLAIVLTSGGSQDTQLSYPTVLAR